MRAHRKRRDRTKSTAPERIPVKEDQSRLAEFLKIFHTFSASVHEVGTAATIFLLDDIPLDAADIFRDIEHAIPVDDVPFRSESRAAFTLFILSLQVHELAATW